MKRVLLGVTVLLGGAFLGGCPVYSNDRYCDGNACYDCPAGTSPSNGTCVSWACGSSSDCAAGYICDPTYTCVPAPFDAGGCGSCPSGYVCRLSCGIAQCTPSEGGLDGGRLSDASIDATSDARLDGAPASDAPAAVDAPYSDVRPSEASAATDAPVTRDGPVSDAPGSADGPSSDAPVTVVDAAAASCNANRECGGDGARCIDGQCVAQGELCSDTTQCVGTDEACVDGVCVPHCDGNAPCPAGYACDFTRGVCDLNPVQCTGSGVSSCVGGSVCVEGRCVAPCPTGDAATKCPGSQLCVNGGCIPDEAARFACKNDGQSGLLANVCSATEICLHHDCYADCDPDGGACADPSQSCKQVTVAAGTYAVCGAASNLGSDCDPAAGIACTSGVCIDGYCR